MSVTAVPAASVLAPAAARPSLWREATRRFRRHRLAMLGAVILLGMVTAVVAGPFVYRVPIDAIDFKAKLKGPSRAPMARAASTNSFCFSDRNEARTSRATGIHLSPAMTATIITKMPASGPSAFFRASRKR